MPLTQVQGGMILPSTTLTTPIVATTMGVGGATPATTGSGITFPATQQSSSNANTLDDYEEGTWTPTIVTTGTAFSNSQGGSGRYTKIGRLVTVSGNVNLNGATSGGTGSVRLGSLPFVSAAGSGDSSGVWLPGRVTLDSAVPGYVLGIIAESTSCAIYITTNIANPSEFPASGFNGNTTPYFNFSITYFTTT